jgi:pilus assembly protein CpaE
MNSYSAEYSDPASDVSATGFGAPASMAAEVRQPSAPGAEDLWIALIGPDEERRTAAGEVFAECHAGDVRKFSSYPPAFDEMPRVLNQQYDVIVIDLDSDPEYALKLVEGICAAGSATVMVYSASADQQMLIRCMRAGAREFLPVPFVRSTVAEALARAAVRRPATQLAKERTGKLLLFMGSKGGAGTTTVACNFAVALGQEPAQKTLLIDLDLPLGDAALNLGISAKYSTINALQSASRLDSSFLATLLVQHSSGLWVLAAPGKFSPFHAESEAIIRLLEVARQDFDNVVVDLGTRFDITDGALFDMVSTCYLVTQTGIAELRNSNRVITQFFTTEKRKLEVVLNRFESNSMGVSEEHIAKALNRPVQWRIPNDYVAVRKMQINAAPLVLTDSLISRQIRRMAKSLGGEVEAEETKKRFRLFG